MSSNKTHVLGHHPEGGTGISIWQIETFGMEAKGLYSTVI